MPIHEVTVKEYECGHCGWKWINRINGEDKPIPNNCAKCKRRNWNNPESAFTPREIGLRRKIKEFDKVYNLYQYPYHDETDLLICFPSDLPEKFLSIEPRPTIKELRQVLYPFGYDLYNQRYQHMVPNPDKPGFLKYIYPYKQDPKRPDQMIYDEDNEFRKLKVKQLNRRQELMIETMKSRGVDYDPEIRLKVQRGLKIKKFNEWISNIDSNPYAIKVENEFKDVVGDGICEKCKKRRMLISDNGNIICKKCETELSENWTYVVMNKRYHSQ